ncbi:HutD family protein [Ideonella azotifigens]|uniref:HutD family protein n=1 Tax=Ideonella azotifigens TaxID=513160 RepID=A0ABN1K1L0_9BURK|nr:HutD family protein [Ideonella azotifigens]MCD2341734.1 HutD family protein [Ideonella azotifigens]
MTTAHGPAFPCAPPRLQVVHFDDVPAQPWRNGGGVTRELAAWPDATDWQLRLSVADIERDGPFSAFPGIARWFVVLSGDGVRLDHGGQQIDLRPGDNPHAFDGGEPPGCTLLGGATRDLNLMLKAPASGRLWPADAPWQAEAGQRTLRWRGLFCAEACTLLTPADTLALPAMSLAWQAAGWADESTIGQDPAALTEGWQLKPAARPPRAWWIALEN